MEYNLATIDSIKQQLAVRPNEVRLINQLAIAYLNVPEAGKYSEVDSLFELAFEKVQQLGTANNLAYWMIIDWGEAKKGLDILIPFVDGFEVPYITTSLIGYAHLILNQYAVAVDNLEVSYDLSKNRLDLNNLCVSLALNNQVGRAARLHERHYIKERPLDNVSFYNYGITLAALKKYEQSKKCIAGIQKSEYYLSNEGGIGEIELCQLAYYIGDFQLAYDLVNGAEGYALSYFPEIAYILYHFNRSRYWQMIEKEIATENHWIQELITTNEEGLSEEEKSDEIGERSDTIEKLNDFHLTLHEAPKVELADLYEIQYCGCKLYGCHRHANPEWP